MTVELTKFETIPEKAVCLKTRVGPLLFVDNSSIAEGIRRKGFHDAGVEYFMQKYLDRLFPFIDVGANVGLFSITAALLGGGGQVYSFEPDPQNVGLFRRNLDHYGLTSVQIEATACAAKDGSIRMGLINCGLSRKSKQEAYKVECQTLHGFCERKAVEPAFIKIDVEGAELDVLEGLLNDGSYSGVTIELEFSWRDHGRHIEDFLKLLPPETHDYEFLLTESERDLFAALDWAKEFCSDIYDRLNPVEFIACVARGREALEQILGILQKSTDELHSRKWELCITPREFTRLPAHSRTVDFALGRVGLGTKAMRWLRQRSR